MKCHIVLLLYMLRGIWACWSGLSTASWRPMWEFWIGTDCKGGNLHVQAQGAKSPFKRRSTHISGHIDAGTARQMLPEGTCWKSWMLTAWISLAPLKSLKRYEISYYTFILHAGRHLGMLKWLVNCFLKALVKFLDWQRMQEWKLACSCPWS